MRSEITQCKDFAEKQYGVGVGPVFTSQQLSLYILLLIPCIFH